MGGLSFGELLTRIAGGSLVAKVTILVVLAGLTRIAVRPAEISHDVAMYLQAGKLLLEGQRPYVDFIDPNPPLVMYLSAVPAAVARALGTALVPTALFIIAYAAILSLVSTHRVLVGGFRRAGHDTLVAEVTILALAYAFFLINVPEAIDPPYPGNVVADPGLSEFFGQREHLFMIGSAPFLAVRFWRWNDGRTASGAAALAGAVASLVTCLKPQFVLVLLPFELALFGSRRRLPALLVPELAAFAAVVAAYAAHFALLPAAVRGAWFDRWLPLVVHGYGAFNDPNPWLLLARCWPAMAALVLAFGMTIVADPEERALTRAFALMALGGAVLYVVQRKGWTYHAYPFRTCTAVVVACTVAAARALGASDDEGGARLRLPLTRRCLGRALAATGGLAALVCAGCLARVDTARDVQRVRDGSPLFRRIERLTRPGDRVLVATTGVWNAYPALTLLDRAPGSRYLWLFPIPMLGVLGPMRADVERDFVRDLAEDVRERRPELLLVQTGHCYACGGASIDGFFRDHPPLASALEAYSLRGTVRDKDDFQVFVRNDASR